jgi:hypothetical protein
LLPFTEVSDQIIDGFVACAFEWVRDTTEYRTALIKPLFTRGASVV